MDIKKKYNLEFIRTKHPTFSNSFSCRNNIPEFPGSYVLSSLLTGLSDLESKAFVEEIEAAQDGRYYEEDYLLDWDSFTPIKIRPPNAEINGFVINLSELKQLLEEWNRFVKS
ncbi:hypothetical protein [Chryseobacterium sp. SIMBA_028]|uniref:hypothetical protein n=1 Tax=Chryseobacterium sp. SIMBA_028 TaxID=3085771 RepID=UPI00397DFE2C